MYAPYLLQNKVSDIKKKQAPRAGPTEPTIETEGDADNDRLFLAKKRETQPL
uniref:Uncharacterized protein n=1 Tax=Brassica campestris TaxID=3711 RepID=M4F667_BRACM